MATSVPPTQYGAPDDDEPSGGRSGNTALIAVSIVIAGLFIGAGIFLALLLRPAGVGDDTGASSTPSSSAAAQPSTAVSAQPSGASPDSSTASSPGSSATNLTLYAWHNCQGMDAPPAQEQNFVDGVELIYEAATESRGGCLVDAGVGRNIALSYHGFATQEDMQAAFDTFAVTHEDHPAMCQDRITGGYGRFSFADGRNGTAVCLRNPGTGSHFLVWTDDAASVITVAFTRRLDDEGADNLLTFWRDDAGN